jgi:NADPH:quinone reductase-like Zn-dependent oxidoreductase
MPLVVLGVDPHKQTHTATALAGKLTPVIDRTYPLVEAPEALRYLEGGHPSGKVVITI